MMLLSSAGIVSAQEGQTKESKAQEKTKVPAALNFKMKSIDGDEVDLSQYSGKVVMIVNVASFCGMTKQYADLQSLHEKHGADGLVILGFPCNQFSGQEPGTEAEIKEFCSTKYNVTFPMFSKVEVKGDGQCDLYRHLTSLDLAPKGSGDVAWNFEKIILNRAGEPVARFGSRVSPSDPEVVNVLKEALGGSE
jgi:glutathione peroxidase